MKGPRMFNKLKDLYYRPKSFEKWKNGRIYELVGIRLFKQCMPLGGKFFVRWFGWKLARKVKDRDKHLEWLLSFTKSAEAIHAWIFLIFIASSIHNYRLGKYHSVFVLMIINLFLNVYPIMTQRYNRLRLYRIMRSI